MSLYHLLMKESVKGGKDLTMDLVKDFTGSFVVDVSYVGDGEKDNVGNGGDEVRLHGPEQVSGDGDSGKPVATGPDPDIGSKLVCDAWTQLPGMAGNPSEALSSVAMAYQVSTTSGTA